MHKTRFPASFGSLRVPRNELFAAVFLFGFANGVMIRVADATDKNGPAAALLNTFDISLFVWIGGGLAIRYVLGGNSRQANRPDLLIAGVSMFASALPVPYVSWLGLAALSIYLILESPDCSSTRRGSYIMLAVTVPVFWSRMLFAALSDPILTFDAILVSMITGTDRLGNTVQLADGSGYLWIAAGCSSLTNVSSAILCWVLFTQTSNRRVNTIGFGVLACLAVVCINVSRIALIGLHPELYNLIHGDVGSTIANWTTVLVTCAICSWGVNRDQIAYV